MWWRQAVWSSVPTTTLIFVCVYILGSQTTSSLLIEHISLLTERRDRQLSHQSYALFLNTHLQGLISSFSGHMSTAEGTVHETFCCGRKWEGRGSWPCGWPIRLMRRTPHSWYGWTRLCLSACSYITVLTHSKIHLSYLLHFLWHIHF